jgi:ABC-type dipeptide/oligopeptide/nickel transport system permease component
VISSLGGGVPDRRLRRHHQYSWGDYGLTLPRLRRLATPNFLLALVLMYFANVEFGFRSAASWTRVPGPAVELGEGALGARAPVDPGDRDRHSGTAA